ncbi:MAG: hypothetical protein M1814_004616 [Vezdaea aestivalis]|nr:MAG: hypothetical protein M1814_004616 [Vezdaea aestivalis]
MPRQSSTAELLASCLMMRSVLTNRVFRRILQNRGYLPRHTRPQSTLQLYRQAKLGNRANRAFTRPFLEWLTDTPKEPRMINSTPGMPLMSDLVEQLTRQLAPPPLEMLVKAWRSAIAWKLDRKEAVKKPEAAALIYTLEHILISRGKDEGRVLSTADIKKAMMTFNVLPNDDLEIHKAFAKALLHEIEVRRATKFDVDIAIPSSSLYPYVKVTCMNGDISEGRDLAIQNWKRTTDTSTQKLFTLCLEGSAFNKDLKSLEETLKVMEEHRVPMDAKSHKAVTTFYAKRDDVEKTKHWYAAPLAEGEEPLDTTNLEVIQFSRRNKQLEWFGSALQSVLMEHPTKRSWDSIFIWAAAIGRPVKEIGRMMDIMVERTKNGEKLSANGHTILGLVEFAYSIDDSSAAEAFVELGESKGVLLDETGFDLDALTFIRLIDLRIKNKDLQGALKAYRSLQSYEVDDNMDVPTINRLAVALCNAEPLDFDLVQSVVSDLERRQMILHPEALAALCKVHLKHDDFVSSHDLVNVHSYQYSYEERKMTRDAFLADFHNSTRNNSSAWDAYVNIRQCFPEMTGDEIYPLMGEFFRRKKPEHAIMVFRGMKEAAEHQQPPLEAYVQCFGGLAAAGNEEEFLRVYNYLKMDLVVDPNTRLRNALMQACMHCHQTRKVWDIWEDIDLSEEGPDRNSIVIILHACARSPYMQVETEVVWNNVIKYKVDITVEMYAAYLAARMRRHKYTEQLKMVEQMEEAVGLKPTVLVLAYLYNVDFTFDIKDKIAEWGKEKFPELWAELESYGVVEDVDEEYGSWTKQFNFDTKIKF